MATHINILDHAPDTLMRTLGWVLSRLEDPTGLARPLCRDYSRWQGKVNFQVAAANGVLLMAARSTISWGYQDAWFPRNWIESNAVGMYRTSYHVIYPDQSIVRQLDNWYKVVPEIDIIPRVIDLELNRGMTARAIGDKTWEMSQLILARDGARPIIYSRYLLLNSWLANWTVEMLNDHFYWLAQYKWDRTREHPGPPTLPNRVKESQVIVHQTADKKAGFAGEVQSMSADWDRWELGDVIDMHNFIAQEWGGQHPPPASCWYEDIDGWARASGFNSVHSPPSCETFPR